MVSYSQCASSVARISYRPWPGDLRLPSPLRLDLVQYTIALADLAAAGKTRRHADTIIGRRKKQNFPQASGVPTTASISVPPAKSQHVSSYLGPEFVFIPASFLATETPGHDPTEPRMNSQNEPAACRGWTGLARNRRLTLPRKWLALDRLSSHGTCSNRCTKFGATSRSPVSRATWPSQPFHFVCQAAAAMAARVFLSPTHARISCPGVRLPQRLKLPLLLRPAELCSALEASTSFVPRNSSGLHSGRNTNHARPRVVTPSRSSMAENVAGRSALPGG